FRSPTAARSSCSAAFSSLSCAILSNTALCSWVGSSDALSSTSSSSMRFPALLCVMRLSAFRFACTRLLYVALLTLPVMRAKIANSPAHPTASHFREHRAYTRQIQADNPNRAVNKTGAKRYTYTYGSAFFIRYSIRCLYLSGRGMEDAPLLL